MEERNVSKGKDDIFQEVDLASRIYCMSELLTIVSDISSLEP